MVCLLIILLIALKQFYGFYHYLDITFFDESEYLWKGIILPKEIYNDWAPSYNVWYYLINSITHNPIMSYYLNFVLLNTIIPILLFFLLIRYSINYKLALLLSILFLTNVILYVNFTYISNFCLVIILLLFIILSYVNTSENKIVTAMIGTLICVFARQEFLLVFILLFIFWLYIVIQQKKIHFSTSYLILFLLIVFYYAFFGGLTFKSGKLDRSYFAFMQHFYVNYCILTKKVYTLDEFKELKLFGNSDTMIECIFNNPVLFLKHLLLNIGNYLLSFLKYVENYLLPTFIFNYLGKIKHILFILILLYVARLFYYKNQYNFLKSKVIANSTLSIIIFIFFISSYFSIFFIFPERHYVLLQFIWWILLIAFIFNKVNYNTFNSTLIFGLITVIFITVPTANKIQFFQKYSKVKEPQPNLKTIVYLNTYNTKDSMQFKMFTPYLASNYNEIFLEVDSIRPYMYAKDSIDMLSYLQDKNIGIIYMNEKMQDLLNNGKIKDKEKFLNNPEEVGYYKQIIDTSLVSYLLIRNK